MSPFQLQLIIETIIFPLTIDQRVNNNHYSRIGSLAELFVRDYIVMQKRMHANHFQDSWMWRYYCGVGMQKGRHAMSITWGSLAGYLPHIKQFQFSLNGLSLIFIKLENVHQSKIICVFAAATPLFINDYNLS